MSVNGSCWTITSLKITEKTNSDHQIQQPHWSEKNPQANAQLKSAEH